MDRALKANIKELIKSKRGFEFEAFLNEMLLIYYGKNGYQPTRERSDDGADGVILTTQTIVAAYAPDTYSERKFLRKVQDDFDDYLNKWVNDYPNWRMYYNNALAPAHIRVSASLKDDANKKGKQVGNIAIEGIDQIMHLVEHDMSNIQQRAVANSLGVAKELLIFDHIRSIIDDLIMGGRIDNENVQYKAEVNIGEKIALNFTGEDARNAEEEYSELAINGTLKKIWDIISMYGVEQINTLKLKIKRDFNEISGGFKLKASALTQKYMDKYTSGQDDDFEYYTRALLVYCFEQCMIGTKTSGEKEGTI